MREAVVFLKSNPFIRLLPALWAGMLSAFYHPLPFRIQAGAGAVLCLLALALRHGHRGHQYQHRGWKGITLLLALAWLGHWRVTITDSRQDPQWFGQVSGPILAVAVQADEYPKFSGKNRRFLGRFKAVRLAGGWQPVTGKLLVYLPGNDTAPALKPGTVLLTRAEPQLLYKPPNPCQFDFTAWCRNKQIFYRLYIPEGQYTVSTQTGTAPPLARFQHLQRSIAARIGEHLPATTAALAAALLVGFREELDKDLVQAYSDTGVVHIIAISGLHLGLLYQLFRWLCCLVPGALLPPQGRSMLALLLIWCFAALTGAGASVLRAAVMFTFLLAGEGLKRKTSTLNLLAASAFFLLLYNPRYTWDAGFQLSYAAVLSLLLFYRALCQRWSPRLLLLRWAWQMVAATLAAQVLTVPLVIFYFHQFPNYFLPANLVAVPLSTLVLYALLPFLFTHQALILKPVAWLAGTLAQLMNRLVRAVAALPGARTEGLWIDSTSLLLIGIALILLALWLHTCRPAVLIATLASVLLFSINEVSRRMYENRKGRLLVWDLPGYSVFEWQQAGIAVYAGSNRFLRDTALFRKWIQPVHQRYRLRYIQTRSDKAVTIETENLVVTSQPFAPGIPSKHKTIIGILSAGSALQLQPGRCALLVADASAPRWKTRRWKKQADSLHLRFHSVPEQGAFTWEPP